MMISPSKTRSDGSTRFTVTVVWPVTKGRKSWEKYEARSRTEIMRVRIESILILRLPVSICWANSSCASSMMMAGSGFSDNGENCSFRDKTVAHLRYVRPYLAPDLLPVPPHLYPFGGDEVDLVVLQRPAPDEALRLEERRELHE